MERVVGLDTGTNSIGWSVIERDGDSVALVDCGVHIFQEGVNIEKGVESSKAAERTSYRALRKIIFRRKLRKIETLKVLTAFGLCPPLSEQMLKEWRSGGSYPLTPEMKEWQHTDDNKGINPYHCRFEAVNRVLDLEQQGDRDLLGRAFYHIAQRRGFLSNRKTASESEDGVVKTGISELDAAMKESGCRTLGEYFYHCYGNEKIRTRYTSRLSHYKAEFDLICEVQQLPHEVKHSLERAIFYQRPLRSQKGQVGKCTFEPKKARCPISHPRYEHYRMLCFLNSVKVITPSDDELRPLTNEEKEQVQYLFLRKSKERFDFEDIAKALAGKGKYAYNNDTANQKPYRFNFRMNTTVSGSPFTAQLKGVFGDNWQEEIHRCYTLAQGKTPEQCVNDIWHVLFSFDSDDCIKYFARTRLQMDSEMAEKFVAIKVKQEYASLSLCAINKIIPFLEQGLLYSHAVFLANMGAILPAEVWADAGNREVIINGVVNEIETFDRKGKCSLQQTILNFLGDNFTLHPRAEERLYHPSMIESYPHTNAGRLGSPRIGAVKNPMAMRTLFQLRRLINKLIAEGLIDSHTKINIETTRELNNANMRKAIADWQKQLDTENTKYAAEIRSELAIEPTETDILKYRLWIEQGKVCLYTGKQIGIADFIGVDPLFDIEHTVPRSVSRDNSQMNKTLACRTFNRQVKRNRIPAELDNFEAVKQLIEPWKEKIAQLQSRIEKSKKRHSFSSKEEKDKYITERNKLVIERNYWQGKYSRMVAESVEQGFSNSQGVDAGIIAKYSVLYLKSFFDKVYTVKGAMTAEFRKLWGLQSSDEAKDRSTHVHHCIDAITIACIGKRALDEMSHYYREVEYYQLGQVEKPYFEKPWATFTEDVKQTTSSLLISHYTPSNVGKHTRKRIRVRGKVVQDRYSDGDTARGSLHQETYYGAIERDGEIKYVVRKSLGSFKNAKEVEKIVDDEVRAKVMAAIEQHGFKEAMATTIWMNEEKQIPIKKMRCYTKIASPLHIRSQRDLSKHEYKQQYHVVGGNNALMAIYEGVDKKGKTKRGFEMLSNYTATAMQKRSSDRGADPDVVPIEKGGLPLHCTIAKGTMVLFWVNSPDEVWELDRAEIARRLYKVTGMSSKNVSGSDYGVIEFRHHQEARPKGELKKKNGLYVMGEPYRPIIGILHSQFNLLVQGVDFELDILGNLKQL